MPNRYVSTITAAPSFTNVSQRLSPRLLVEESPGLLRSLKSNLQSAFSPETLPPLKLTSRPAAVKSIWDDSKRSGAATISVLLHAMVIAAMVGFSVMGAKVMQAARPQEVVQLVAPDISAYMPITAQKTPSMGGGGGGGDHDKIQAPKGRLPKASLTPPIVPPALIVRTAQPMLPVEPSIVMPPSVHIPESRMPNLGNPRTSVVNPASNGVGAAGGIGSGSGGGIGLGTAAGHGPGSGGGYGGGVYRVGGGVTAPRAISAPEPEYSEEARMAKYQGTVVLWLIVDQNGRPGNMRIARGLGMGLDQKAMEAVRKWKFEPATKDGRPVAVQIDVEVNFRLF